MLIYNQCWKLCCLIFFGTRDIFQDSLGNKKNSVYSKCKVCVTLYTIIQKFGISKFFLIYYYLFFYTFIQQGCVKWIKSDSKDFYIVRKYLYIFN